MRDTKYILFLLARGKEREIAKEEDQCKKEQGSDYLKNQQSVYLCVPSGESGYLRGFLSIVTFVFLDLGGGYAKASYVATCYTAKLCFLYFSVCASLHLTKWYHFPPSYSSQKCWSHLDSSLNLTPHI